MELQSCVKMLVYVGLKVRIYHTLAANVLNKHCWPSCISLLHHQLSFIILAFVLLVECHKWSVVLSPLACTWDHVTACIVNVVLVTSQWQHCTTYEPLHCINPSTQSMRLDKLQVLFQVFGTTWPGIKPGLLALIFYSLLYHCTHPQKSNVSQKHFLINLRTCLNKEVVSFLIIFLCFSYVKPNLLTNWVPIGWVSQKVFELLDLFRAAVPNRGLLDPRGLKQDFLGPKCEFSVWVCMFLHGCTSFTVEPRFIKTCKSHYSKEHYSA